MKKFTVLLLYPDYIGDYGHESYMAHVKARGVKAAVRKAQIIACKANDIKRERGFADPADDFQCMAVFAGWHSDIACNPCTNGV